MATSGRGKLVILSGPSGVGKTTLVQKVLKQSPVPLALSVSATTRPPRAGEVDGVDYRFLTNEEFQLLREKGEFLECFQVFGTGHWYGTLMSQVTPGLAAGKDVLLTIDVNGARMVVARFPDTLTIFVRPSSLEVLEKRLRARHTDSEATIQRRLEEAKCELAAARWYSFQVVNDVLEEAVQQICDILVTERG